jgi:hypothetical protein
MTLRKFSGFATIFRRHRHQSDIRLPADFLDRKKHDAMTMGSSTEGTQQPQVSAKQAPHPVTFFGLSTRKPKLQFLITTATNTQVP